MSIADYLEDQILETVFNGGAYGGQSTVYVKLHLGDPGEACTANPAVETTRQAMTATGGSSGGTISNDADLAWTNVADDETFSHWSAWDDPTTGNALWYGTISPPVPMTAGGDFTIATGDLVVTVA